MLRERIMLRFTLFLMIFRCFWIFCHSAMVRFEKSNVLTSSWIPDNIVSEIRFVFNQIWGYWIQVLNVTPLDLKYAIDVENMYLQILFINQSQLLCNFKYFFINQSQLKFKQFNFDNTDLFCGSRWL